MAYESKRDAEFQNRARLAFRRFLRHMKGQPWIAERFCDWIEQVFPLELWPKDWRSIGQVIRWAKDEGLIRRVGSAPARTSHGNWKPKWVACR